MSLDLGRLVEYGTGRTVALVSARHSLAFQRHEAHITLEQKQAPMHCGANHVQS
jgi:hypothetical protein